MLTDHDNPRIIIENIYPEVDGGRYPVKRAVGDQLDVWADIYMEGHDGLKAALLYQEPGELDWKQVPLVPMGNDRFEGVFPLTEQGRYGFTIKAWPDHFGTWARNTKKSQAAGQDISMEIMEGQQLFHPLLSSLKKIKQPPAALKSAIAIISKGEGQELVNFLLSDEAETLYVKHAWHEGVVAYPKIMDVWVDRKRAEFSAWYEMFPRSQGNDPTKSGTFADCERRLPDIKQMGFDVVYLPPIHPIGLQHRKGKNNSLTAGPNDPGSPYAIGSEEGGHKAIHPELGSLKSFQRFVKAANKLGMEVALDFAVQVSRDHPYIKEHPEWFRFRPDGSLKYAENPPKKYEDIANVNFDSGKPLWDELKSVVQFWIDQGVTIFRVDNPHTKPFPFWEWLIELIHKDRPDIIFLAEAFTRPKIMYLLAKGGFTQSYSYFTWRNTKQELTEYLTELTTDWPKETFRPNFFPTTPDIFPEYLHRSGRPGFIIRLALAATLASNYGIYSGYELCEGKPLAPGKEEYLDSEKYEIKVRDWNLPGNIKPFVTQLNAIRNQNPALQQFKGLRFYPASNDRIIFYAKMTADKSNVVFIAVNLDYANPQEAFIDLPLWELGLDSNRPVQFDDLLLGHSWSWTGSRQHLRLEPQRNPVAIFRIKRP